MDYQKQATEFMEETETTMTAKHLDHAPYFGDDDKARDIWRITLRRRGKSCSFKYGQSLTDIGKTPTAYAVLTCLTKYEPSTFQNFCDEYGYDNDSRRAEKLYKAAVKEFKGVERLFGDVIDKLVEIQ